MLTTKVTILTVAMIVFEVLVVEFTLIFICLEESLL
jgi:hypothetical protein